MTRVVADASVIVKWLLPDRAGESDSDRASALLSGVLDGTVDLVQPPHWLAEVAAVLARLSPDTVDDDVADLYALALPVLDTPGVYLRACRLANAMGQHVFDTLYHAVALETRNATLVTADLRYYRQAARQGSIVPLGQFTLPGGGGARA